MNNQNPQSQIRQQVSHDEISRRAKELWRQYGSPQGRDEEIWLEAERQLRGTPPSLDTPASEGVGASQSNGADPSNLPSDTPKPRDTEMMEGKKSPPSKASRSKGKPGGK